MRRGFDALALTVRQVIGTDPRGGAVFDRASVEEIAGLGLVDRQQDLPAPARASYSESRPPEAVLALLDDFSRLPKMSGASATWAMTERRQTTLRVLPPIKPPPELDRVKHRPPPPDAMKLLSSVALVGALIVALAIQGAVGSS